MPGLAIMALKAKGVLAGKTTLPVVAVITGAGGMGVFTGQV